MKSPSKIKRQYYLPIEHNSTILQRLRSENYPIFEPPVFRKGLHPFQGKSLKSFSEILDQPKNTLKRNKSFNLSRSETKQRLIKSIKNNCYSTECLQQNLLKSKHPQRFTAKKPFFNSQQIMNIHKRQTSRFKIIDKKQFQYNYFQNLVSTKVIAETKQIIARQKSLTELGKSLRNPPSSNKIKNLKLKVQQKKENWGKFKKIKDFQKNIDPWDFYQPETTEL